MAEAANGLLLQGLRQARGEGAGTKRDVVEMMSAMKDVDQKVDGLSIIPAGHVHSIGKRVEALEEQRA